MVLDQMQFGFYIVRLQRNWRKIDLQFSVGHRGKVTLVTQTQREKKINK